MCGICGKLSWDAPPERETIQKMNDRLVHRGPDAEGIYINGPVGLGHRRLSIIDLSEAGNQPMADSSGRFHIVYNGEVYNFQELRRELETGASFKSRTDTEVILEGYKRWGAGCLERFNGMFAFAIWDNVERSLFLARDRLGKKPLYYMPLPGGGVVFASELKALAEDPGVPRRLNPKALSHYLSLNYTLTDECMLDGVRKLRAAHYTVFTRGKQHRETRYWDLAKCFHNKTKYRSEEEAAEELRSILEDSVRIRMISDVPLGAFLSGGVDSSSIVAAMTRAGAPETTHTFSIGFDEKTYSELPEARFAANLLKVRHRDKVVSTDLAALLPKIGYFFDEPFSDTSMIPMYYLAEFARKHVTVCLSGDGGDEIFAGYETYSADKIRHLSGFMPGWAVGLVRRAVERFLPVSFDKVSFDYKLRQFLAGHSLNLDKAHYFWRTIFTEEEKKALLPPELHRELDAADPWECFSKHAAEVSDCHYLDRAMYVDIKTWLADDILVKVDRSTMAHSLEARGPFLDYRLVEFAAALPVWMKMKGFQKKYLLKKSQKKYLPDSILYRKKMGFNAPVSHWMSQSLQPFLEKAFLGARDAGGGQINVKEVEKLWKEHTDKSRDNGLKLLNLLNFSFWQDEFLK